MHTRPGTVSDYVLLENNILDLMQLFTGRIIYPMVVFLKLFNFYIHSIITKCRT